MKQRNSVRLDPDWQPWGPLALWMTPDVAVDQPERYEMEFRRIRAWERVREESSHRRYSDASKIRNMTKDQVRRALETAVKDMNNWLFKGELGDHPNSAFVNFFKKTLAKEAGGLYMLDRDARNGISPSSILVTVKDKAVADLHFYTIGWPSYAVPLLQQIREESAKLNFRALKENKSVVTGLSANKGTLEQTLDNIIGSVASFKIK